MVASLVLMGLLLGVLALWMVRCLVKGTEYINEDENSVDVGPSIALSMSISLISPEMSVVVCPF